MLIMSSIVFNIDVDDVYNLNTTPTSVSEKMYGHTTQVTNATSTSPIL
jgi:hypothetical protein